MQIEQELEKKVVNILKDLRYKLSTTQKINTLPSVEKTEILYTLQRGIIISKTIEDNIEILKKEQLIFFNDIEKNEFSINCQKLDYKSPIDLVIFVNRIPIMLVQLANKVNIAQDQISRNFEYIQENKNFRTVQLLVAIGNDDISYKLNKKSDVWKTWNTIDYKTSTLEERIETFFKKDTILDILKNYILEIKNNNIIASYYQYLSTKQLLNSKEKENKVCYAAGTGKKTSILFLINNLYKKNRFAKILLIVDRLIEQEYFEKNLKSFIKSEVEVALTRQDLEKLLTNAKTQIVITTSQKLLKYNSKNLGEMYIISNVKDIYEEDFIKDKSLEIFPNSVLIKYSNFKNKEEKVLYNYSETQALQDGLLTKIFYVAEELKRKSEINVENDLKEILVQNENLSIEELQELHQKATSQAIIKDITSSYIENKIIIYTKYENCIHYLEELSKFKTVATTSVSDYMKENETIQNLKRENGTIENYKKESLNDFNNDNLEILVVSSLEELQKIVTPNVTKIYIDTSINVKILQEITEILSKKNKNKNIGILIDFAKNNELIANYKKESQNVQDISILINKTRVLLLDLVSKANKIEEKLKESKSINNILTIIEIEEYQILVKSLIEKLFFLFSSEKQIEKIPKDEIKIYKESLKMILKLLDKISVIYAKEIEDPNQIEKLCKIMGIENFAFTVISKNDIIQYPNLSGTWKELKFCQKVEALKNRLKIYMFYSDKTTLDMVESDYIEGKIDKTTYFNYIEKFKEDYVRKVINKKIPTKIKKSRFSEILYENIKNKMYLKALNVNSEEILINLILN